MIAAGAQDTLCPQRDDMLDALFRRNVVVQGAVRLCIDRSKVVIAFRRQQPGAISRCFFHVLGKDVDGVYQVAGLASRFQVRLAASIVSDAVSPIGPIPSATNSSAALP